MNPFVLLALVTLLSLGGGALVHARLTRHGHRVRPFRAGALSAAVLYTAGAVPLLITHVQAPALAGWVGFVLGLGVVVTALLESFVVDPRQTRELAEQGPPRHGHRDGGGESPGSGGSGGGNGGGGGD